MVPKLKTFFNSERCILGTIKFDKIEKKDVAEQPRSQGKGPGKGPGN